MPAIEINQNEFEDKVLKSEIPVVVDFYANWCKPCQMMKPIIDKISENSGNKFEVYKVNTEFNGDLSNQFDIISIPTLLIFKNGQIGGTLKGFRPFPVVVEFIGRNV